MSIDFGDLSHLSPEDADLYRALYTERNVVSRGELARVRNNAERVRIAWLERPPRPRATGPVNWGVASESSIRRALATRTERAPNGCLLWTGPTSRDGYASFKYGPNHGHRVAYILAKGPIPAEFTVDHVCHSTDPHCLGGPTCRHRRCLEPDHLEIVTAVENTRRTGRRMASCRRGHLFTPENTRENLNGTRACRTCIRATRRAAAAARRAAKPASADGRA